MKILITCNSTNNYQVHRMRHIQVMFFVYVSKIFCIYNEIATIISNRKSKNGQMYHKFVISVMMTKYENIKRSQIKSYTYEIGILHTIKNVIQFGWGE